MDESDWLTNKWEPLITLIFIYVSSVPLFTLPGSQLPLPVFAPITDSMRIHFVEKEAASTVRIPIGPGIEGHERYPGPVYVSVFLCFLSNVHDITYTCSTNENTKDLGEGRRLLEYTCLFASSQEKINMARNNQENY